jgi:hypothetical protein
MRHDLDRKDSAVNLRRTDRNDEPQGYNNPEQIPFTATAMQTAQPKTDTKASDENGGISVFWRVFGGTIVSIVALVAVTIYNSLNTQVSELRNEIRSLTQADGEHVRKDEFSTRMTSQWDRVQNLQSQHTEQNAILRSLRTELDGIKEKLSNLTSDTKSTREDTTKLRQDVDKNVAADLERKARRDEQYKDIDKTMKDLTASLQELQIKLARLEGAQATPKQPRTTPNDKSKDAPKSNGM